MDVLGSPFLTVRRVSVDVKQHWTNGPLSDSDAVTVSVTNSATQENEFRRKGRVYGQDVEILGGYPVQLRGLLNVFAEQHLMKMVKGERWEVKHLSKADTIKMQICGLRMDFVFWQQV